MGNMQFMPSTFTKWAVDRDGNGSIDIWNSMPDAFASAANFLRGIGFKPGLPASEEVFLPQNFPLDQADTTVEKPVRAWAAMGVKRAGGAAAAGKRRALVDHPAGRLARPRLHPLSQLQGGDELEPLDALCAVGHHPGAADRGRPAGHAAGAGRRRAAVARHRGRHADAAGAGSASTPTRPTACWVPRRARRCACSRSRPACRPTAIRRPRSCAACSRRRGRPSQKAHDRCQAKLSSSVSEGPCHGP